MRVRLLADNGVVTFLILRVAIADLQSANRLSGAFSVAILMNSARSSGQSGTNVRTLGSSLIGVSVMLESHFR